MALLEVLVRLNIVDKEELQENLILEENNSSTVNIEVGNEDEDAVRDEVTIRNEIAGQDEPLVDVTIEDKEAEIGVDLGIDGVDNTSEMEHNEEQGKLSNILI